MPYGTDAAAGAGVEAVRVRYTQRSRKEVVFPFQVLTAECKRCSKEQEKEF
jgi:hypothetical protein